MRNHAQSDTAIICSVSQQKICIFEFWSPNVNFSDLEIPRPIRRPSLDRRPKCRSSHLGRRPKSRPSRLGWSAIGRQAKRGFTQNFGRADRARPNLGIKPLGKFPSSILSWTGHPSSRRNFARKFRSSS